MQRGISQELFVCVVSAMAGILVPFWCCFGAMCVLFHGAALHPQMGMGLGVCSPRRSVHPFLVMYFIHSSLQLHLISY